MRNFVSLVLLLSMFATPVFAQTASPTKSAEELLKESEEYCASTANDKPTPALLMEKVNKASELLSKEGTAAFPKFYGKGSEFIFAGTYIWIHSLTSGNMILHPMKPKLMGKDCLSMKDPNGKALFVEMNTAAKAKPEGDWVDYMWAKPGSKDPAPKVSFVRLVKVGEEEFIVGCGVYDLTLDEVRKAAASK